jgi:hypothetical protein
MVKYDNKSVARQIKEHVRRRADSGWVPEYWAALIICGHGHIFSLVEDQRKQVTWMRAGAWGYYLRGRGVDCIRNIDLKIPIFDVRNTVIWMYRVIALLKLLLNSDRVLNIRPEK